MEHIYQPIYKELKQVKENIEVILNDLSFASEYVSVYFNTQAKNIRPCLVITCAKAMNDNLENDFDLLKKLCNFAASLELIHTASLIHDDIMDHEKYRRGQISLNNKYGCDRAVLLGDMLYTRTLKFINDTLGSDILDQIIDVIDDMCKGQFLEIDAKNFNKQKYLDMITLKTGSLIKLSCEGIFLIDNNINKKYMKNFNEYGMSLGILYQLIDDIKDGDGKFKLTLNEIDNFAIKAKSSLTHISNSIYKTKLLEFVDNVSSI
ncbi:polyprenyl synthetase family protein [bacterium]